MIVVIDYGRGNLFSIEQALRHLGADYLVSGDAQDIMRADRFILPGVGAFGDAMNTLFRLGLVSPIREKVRAGTPALGICLGMQLLFETSDEFGHNAGLALLPGDVKALPAGPMRIPNVGWRELHTNPDNPFLRDTAPGSMVYFVHSFVPVPADAAVVAATIGFNGTEVAIAIARDNIMGFQFHPEKSGPVGLGLIGKFLDAAP